MIIYEIDFSCYAKNEMLIIFYLFAEMSAGSVTPTLSESGSQTIVPMQPDSLSSCSHQNGHHHHFHHIQQSHSLDDQTIVPISKRICLVGTVVDDKVTLAAAQAFNVPVITSETGSEFIEDESWITYFILNDFEGPLYEAISKMQHKYVYFRILLIAMNYSIWFHYLQCVVIALPSVYNLSVATIPFIPHNLVKAREISWNFIKKCLEI